MAMGWWWVAGGCVVGHAGLFVTPHQSYVADGYGEDDVTPTGRFVLDSLILNLSSYSCLLAC
jgi:hypothetical protein